MAIDFQSVLARLKEFDNETIIRFLGEMQIGEYIHNLWFLGAMVVLAICCLVFKWRVLLSMIVGLTGLAWLTDYTLQKGTEVSEGLQSNSLILFIAGAAVVIGVMIYIVFIKEE